jgi:metal-responsive CopG/Arc/MetJ family transcriptional regulator
MTVKTIVRQKQKKIGRPVTVAAERSVTVRLPLSLFDEIDAWATANKASKSEAFRALLERGLAAPAPRKPKGKSAS